MIYSSVTEIRQVKISSKKKRKLMTHNTKCITFRKKPYYAHKNRKLNIIT